ncbi:MAG TPA: hypothetical protein VGB51_03190 [Actinomycetota bacterium]
MKPVVIFLLVAAAGIGLAVLAWRAREKRRQAFRAFALAHGLEYAIDDPFGTIDIPFGLFRKGDGRGIENVVWGRWREAPMRFFDHWYYEQSTDSKGHTSRTYYRQSCVLVEVAAQFPHLSITREGFFSRLADHLGFRDIEFESEDFNKAFQVGASERRFAFELIDARLMAWLLTLEWGMFEVLGSWALVYVKGRRAPAEFAPVIELAEAFRGRIPRAAWSLYGAGNEGTKGEQA